MSRGKKHFFFFLLWVATTEIKIQSKTKLYEYNTGWHQKCYKDKIVSIHSRSNSFAVLRGCPFQAVFLTVCWEEALDPLASIYNPVNYRTCFLTGSWIRMLISPLLWGKYTDIHTSSLNWEQNTNGTCDCHTAVFPGSFECFWFRVTLSLLGDNCSIHQLYQSIENFLEV